jgi:intermembrane space import and assembly protein 40
LEEEAEQQGAFNEETGEINWDCPCLGGMAHGPCGEQFRAAFSCFVYSKEEPKGVECIEHFKTMQNCFREHPEIYGSELDDEEVAEVQAEEDRAQASLQGAGEGERQSAAPSQRAGGEESQRAEASTQQIKRSDSEA